MTVDYLTRILNARVYDVAIESPLELAPNLSRRVGCPLWLKREDEQPVFSFKLRGAYNKMAGLREASRARGVIAASAGNHAQGVALAAQRLGCPAVIVMPVTTPRIKVDAVRARGAEVVLHGDAYDEAYAEARSIAKARKLTFVHPYDDPDVIAGQGTIGMEILRQMHRPPHAIFAAVGGGGLIAGVAAYVKRLRPEVKIIGVEPVDSAAMTRSLDAGRRVRLAHVGLFADGVAVRRVGKETFRLARKYVDEMVLVTTDEICAAIKDVFEDTRSILEPAGALAIAGAKKWAQRHARPERALVAIACGANTNFDRLRFVAERAEVGERREALLAVTIPERPGSFKRLCKLLGRRSVTELSYRIAGSKDAHVFVGVQVEDRNTVATLVRNLREHDLRALDLTDDELAKLHVRHLVGGRSALAEGERVFRFEFPERPGALMAFLERMSGDWNVTLFHYRNHGADWGRVLAGIKVPAEEQSALRRYLSELGYAHVEETANPAYALFLR